MGSNPEKKMRTELNSFMGKYGIEEISFGKKHSLKRTKGKEAKSITPKSKK